MDLTNLFHYLAGVLLVYAYDDLSFKKFATQSHTHEGYNYAAGNAVDRNITTCTRPQTIGRNSLDKTVCWTVDLGGVYNIFSINVLFKRWDGYEDRQRGRFAGFSLYVSNTDDIHGSTLCYKNGPDLPPLNFTTTCTEHGRYVIFYNERLDGVTYPEGYEVYNVFTELCEVIVQGCNRHGMYGSNCHLLCPKNCKYNICHIQHGSCFGCKAGWTGASCEIKCSDGWYGVNCSHQCGGHCRDNATCNHVAGQCERGCDAGWTGYLCDKECVDGMYGHGCVKKCSGNCLNGSSCNKQTGYCDRGCNPGYLNNYCIRECSFGYFGPGCNYHCPGFCLNNESCDHVSGICPRGCMDGYTGALCNIHCEPGYYGANCSRTCPPNCKTCRHTDGLCSCKAGWMGYDCRKECIMSYGENCQYPCSLHCINQTCDRFDGKCLCECIQETESLVSLESTAVTESCLFWIVAFSLSLVNSVIFMSTTFIFRRKLFLQQKPTVDNVNFSWSTSNTEQTVTIDEQSHYQDLRVSHVENTYQTLLKQ